MKKLCFIFLFSILSACFSVGTESIQDIASYLELQKGQSTKRDIYRIFGQPHDVDRGNWIYYKADQTLSPWTLTPIFGLAFGGYDVRLTTAHFFFEDQVFSKLKTELRNSYVNQYGGMLQYLPSEAHDGRVERVKAEMTSLNLAFDQEPLNELTNKIGFVILPEVQP